MPYKKIIEAITIDSKQLATGETLITVIAKGIGKKSLIVRGSQKITSKQIGKVDILSRFHGVIVERKSGLDYLIESEQIANYFDFFSQNDEIQSAIFKLLSVIKFSSKENLNDFSYEDLQNTLFDSTTNEKYKISILWLLINIIETSGFFSFQIFENILRKNPKFIYFDDEINHFLISNSETSKILVKEKVLKLVLALKKFTLESSKKILVEKEFIDSAFFIVCKIASKIF